MGKYHGNVDVKKYHYSIRYALNEKRKIKILKEVFKRRTGYELDLSNPKSMNEKIMWLKLYYQNPLITKCADKFAVKEYVSDKIGSEYCVPTIASWERPEDINFDLLPNQFVLKVNWSTGYNIVVKDKSQLDIEKTRRILNGWMRPDRNAYYQYFNWGFKHMKPVLYAEEYLEQFDGQVYDYKFFMCNGKMEFMLIATDRSNDEELTHDFYDRDFKHIDAKYGEIKNAEILPSKPKNYDKMIKCAEVLSKEFPFVRVDFYEIDNRIYLGEMTFYPAGGLKTFTPVEFDYYFGSKIELPRKQITDKENFITDFFGMIILCCVNIMKALKRIRKKIIHKYFRDGEKYIVVFGVRIPYKTHVEIDKTINKKYINIFGIEFCYKHIKKDVGINTEIEYKYEENSSILSFQLEDKITPQIQRIHCEQKAYKQMGYFPNLKKPETLNEKIIWLALNYKNDNIRIAADKGKAKKWISSRIGSEYVVPLIGVYEDVNDIEFDKLPKRFVAKLNDGWGADEVLIVRDKTRLNIDKTKAILSSWLYPWNNYYYKNMCITDEKMENATIVIEEYLDCGENSQPDDYKLYCCNGEPKFALVVSGRGGDVQTRTFVDIDWNVLPVSRKGIIRDNNVKKPQNLELMIELCRKLTKDFPFVRVDFYEVNGKVYVGEMTFTPGMFLKFSSKEWDKKLGQYLKLPIE